MCDRVRRQDQLALDQRHEHGGDDHDGEAGEDASDVVVDQHQGEKGGDGRHRAENRRRGHTADAGDGGGDSIGRALSRFMDALADHDRVVDQDAEHDD